MVDLIFVSKVNIPNLSLLPCLEVTEIKILDGRTEQTDGHTKPLIAATLLHKNKAVLINLPDCVFDVAHKGWYPNNNSGLLIFMVRPRTILNSVSGSVCPCQHKFQHKYFV